DGARRVLGKRLRALVGNGIMERREYREQGQRARIEYPLTRMGQGLALPFMAMTQWADKWLGGGHSPLTLRSKSTGQRLSVALVDERCRRAERADIEFVIDVGATRSMARRLEHRRRT